jgi:hypothetical protein
MRLPGIILGGGMKCLTCLGSVVDVLRFVAQTVWRPRFSAVYVPPVRRRMQKSLRRLRCAARLDRFTGFHAGAQTALFH